MTAGVVLKEGRAKLKVPGGKLLTVKIRYDDMISEIQIVGDFFIFPEDALPKIEGALVGMRADEDANVFSKNISDVAAHNGIELIGITPDAIAQAMKMAIK
jgi:lipoate-protein ligase A